MEIIIRIRDVARTFSIETFLLLVENSKTVIDPMRQNHVKQSHRSTRDEQSVGFHGDYTRELADNRIISFVSSFDKR